MTISLKQGFDTKYKEQAAQLYEQAFGAKFSCAISDAEQRITILAESFKPQNSFAVFNGVKLVGLAGFQTHSGAFTGNMTAKALLTSLGFIKGAWACLIFSLFERKPKQGELVMDGIAVDALMRGQGIGSQLLDNIIQYAKENHYSTIRLDVINSNPRAQKLYQSKGFVVTKTDYFPYLKWLVGFSGATSMHYRVDR